MKIKKIIIEEYNDKDKTTTSYEYMKLPNKVVDSIHALLDQYSNKDENVMTITISDQ